MDGDDGRDDGDGGDARPGDTAAGAQPRVLGDAAVGPVAALPCRGDAVDDWRARVREPGGRIDYSITHFKRRFGEAGAEGDYFIATNWQSALSGGGNAFSIVGATAASFVVDYTGYKYLILATTLLNIASVGIEFGTTTMAVFFAGKMVNCIAIGAYQTLCTAYVADIAPLAIRASVLGFCNLAQYQYLGVSDATSFHYQIGAQVLSMAGATLAFLVADWHGRRPIFLVGCASTMVLLLCMAVSGSVATTAGTTASVGFYTMFNFVYNFGLGSGVYALAGEIPTSVLRSKTLAVSMSASNACNTMWSFVCPYLSNPGYGNLKAKIGFVFGAIMAVWTAAAFYIEY